MMPITAPRISNAIRAFDDLERNAPRNGSPSTPNTHTEPIPFTAASRAAPGAPTALATFQATIRAGSSHALPNGLSGCRDFLAIAGKSHNITISPQYKITATTVRRRCMLVPSAGASAHGMGQRRLLQPSSSGTCHGGSSRRRRKLKPEVRRTKPDICCPIISRRGAAGKSEIPQGQIFVIGPAFVRVVRADRGPGHDLPHQGGGTRRTPRTVRFPFISCGDPSRTCAPS